MTPTDEQVRHLVAETAKHGEVLSVHHVHTSQSGRRISFATAELSDGRLTFQITSEAPDGRHPPFVIRVGPSGVADMRAALDAFEKRRVEVHAALPKKPRPERKPWQYEGHTPGVPRGSASGPREGR